MGKIEKCDLREVWPLELDFSRWLANHIQALDEQVRWNIDPTSIRQEVTKGKLRVDLLVDVVDPETNKSSEVVIENQLDATNDGHLAGVMTYLSAFKASGFVWIASDVTQEYAETVQWLNDKSEIDAYLFRLEAIRIGNSRPAPLLTRIVGPLKFPSGGRSGDPVRSQKIRDWWERVLNKIGKTHVEWNSLRPSAQSYNGPTIPKAPGEAIAWYVNATDHYSSIGLWIKSGPPEEVAYYHSQLNYMRKEIESVFGDDLLWTSKRFVYWANPRQIGYADSPSEQEEAIEVLVEAMDRLVTATKDIVPTITPFQR
ncbi:MAG: DUF4268 domain-containing protein [Gemmatimonadetes bacterium]|nr:DUF4268 domain-containing protein [Gemmatimonadota bacterium]